MFFAEAQIRVHLYGQPTDMRKSYDGLQALARHAMGHNSWISTRRLPSFRGKEDLGLVEMGYRHSTATTIYGAQAK